VDQWPHIRRLANGAIDLDFYRGRARALRSAAIGDFFRGQGGRWAALSFLARLRSAWKS